MKKVLVILLLVYLLVSSIPASATEASGSKELLIIVNSFKNADINFKSTIETDPIDVTTISKAWNDMILNEEFTVLKSNGIDKLVFSSKEYDNSPQKKLLLETLNELLEIDAIRINSDGEFYTPNSASAEQVTSDFIKQHKKRITTENMTKYNANPNSTINLLSMCSKNLKELKDKFLLLSKLSEITPSLNPSLITTGWWIDKVRTGGDWDYKSVDGYKPWNKVFDAYYDNCWHCITSEYIGNFNYGYTGSYLFNLNTLFFGSYAVSGFSPKDLEDWPAIQDGYNHAH